MAETEEDKPPWDAIKTLQNITARDGSFFWRGCAGACGVGADTNVADREGGRDKMEGMRGQA